MCDSCGCGPDAEGAGVTFYKPGHSHGDGHHHHHAEGRTITVEEDVLSANDRLAEQNRDFFAAKNILALNLVSSPGSGKTTILERTIRDLQNRHAMAVIEGDQQTARDAERISATGVEVVQVNTGAGCHLDSAMVDRAMSELSLDHGSVLFIENVGNLVCPAMFDLGEAAKVVIISVTEGEDKPEKYPNMFHASTLCLINKIDLLPHLDFDVAACRESARRVNPDLEFIEISATTGEGVELWYAWLGKRAVGDPG